MLLVSFQTLFCCIVYISDMYTDKVIIINTKDHITQTLVTLDHIPQTFSYFRSYPTDISYFKRF
jgi:hypothetical protein